MSSGSICQVNLITDDPTQGVLCEVAAAQHPLAKARAGRRSPVANLLQPYIFRASPTRIPLQWPNTTTPRRDALLPRLGKIRISPMAGSNWHTITESGFPWERDALEFVRSRFPDREPFRAWANFEFIADDGSINEVDLLVLTPVGFFLVEIKPKLRWATAGRPGRQVAGRRRRGLLGCIAGGTRRPGIRSQGCHGGRGQRATERP